MVPPVGQFEATTAFIAAITYPHHHVALMVPSEAPAPLLDGVPVEEPLVAVGTSGWRVAVVPVSSGAHIVESEAPVGVVTYGYGRDAGYGHAGGQALRDLRDPQCDSNADCEDSPNLCFGQAEPAGRSSPTFVL